MRETPGMMSYPVFPNWVFEGKLELSEEIAMSLLSHVSSLPLQKTDFGGMSDKNKRTDNILSLETIMGALFVDTAKPHFRMSEELVSEIDSVYPQVAFIEPGCNVPASISRRKWYHGAAWLDVEDEGGPNVYLEDMGAMVHTTPLLVQTPTKEIKAEYLKTAFWPGHIPWGFTKNKSDTTSIVFLTSYVFR